LRIDNVVIPEQPVEGRPLGRHVHHDSRSRLFELDTSGVTLKNAEHDFHISTLDQGQLGSCTGNAGTGCLSTDPFNTTIEADNIKLDETYAVSLYSDATKIDPYQGTYPPTDTGSDGLSIAKVLKTRGLISGYLHTFNREDALKAIVKNAVIIGISWYSGFDEPDANGHVVLSGQVRGGHEVCVYKIDVDNKLIWFHNSWGDTWGIKGCASMSWDDFGRLLDEKGDVTSFVPVSDPTPTPTDPTAALVAVAKPWVAERHTTPNNKKMAQALKAWLKAEGL
jgi:Papain family cysteine protease